MAASFLVLDIETVLDPELPISQSGEVERLPAPPHHKIVVIGALLFDQLYQVRRIAVLAEGKDEPRTIGAETPAANKEKVGA